MEAKDTIMTFVEQNKEIHRVERGREQTSGCLIRKQAEISLKAGIREVVGWIENNTGEGNQYWNTLLYPTLLLSKSKWQEQLKKWGL